MEQQDTLLTLAEIAATFVGFSTIVVVFRSAGSELQRLYLLDVAVLGLLVTALSVLPVMLADFPLLEPFLWRWGSLLLALTWPIGWFTRHSDSRGPASARRSVAFPWPRTSP
jgi:hypothetical protein